MQVKIFSILDFKHDEQGDRRCHLHYVAATSSAEAESVFRRADVQTEETYIITDDIIAMGRNPAVVTYASSLREDGPITDADHQRWVSVMTRAYREAGELTPATYRRI